PSVSIGLQQLLQYYLQTIESEWIRYIEHCAPFDNLKQVDNAIVVFQEQKLVPLWQSLEHQYKPYITQLLSKKTSLLQAQNTYIWNGLKLPIFLRWDQTSVAHIYQATIGKNRASTHLYYDSAYLLPREKQILIQRYIKQQFVRLHHLCPSVERCAPREYREQLRHFIVYLSAHVSSDKPFYFPNHYTAMMICVDLYECTKSFLSGHNDDLELQISGLRLKINHHPLGFFSLSLKEQLETQFLSFYYRWLERPMVKQSADTIYHLVNQLNAAPQDVNQCKQLIQLLYEQEHHLAQIGWYFSLLRFFGIKNTYDLLRKSIQLLEEMVALGQIALDVHEEAKADAQTAPVLRDMNALLQNVSIRPPDDEAWKQVLLNIKKIQTTSSGMGMWYELRDYVLHQQQKFVRIERNYFFGTKHIDPMDELLRKINTVLERVPISSLNRLDSIYLKQKAKQLSSSDSNIYIQAHYLGQQYFDIWTSSISHQTVKDPFKYFEALNQIIQINSVPILRSNSSSPGFARISFTGRTLKRTSSDHIVLKRHPNISHSEKIDTCLSSELAFVKRVYSKSALFHFIHHHDEHSVEGQHASSLMFV
ncbi:MAG TPA: hypothetical protein VHD33_05490, partial [Legionellaceae bacterium]|nr:hypothetical protein [Legionellaceae bacterium]